MPHDSLPSTAAATEYKKKCNKKYQQHLQQQRQQARTNNKQQQRTNGEYCSMWHNMIVCPFTLVFILYFIVVTIVAGAAKLSI